MSTMTNFLGSFLQLQDRVMLTQYLGRWEDRGNHKMFRAENGAVMHWWLPKGTIRFNGRADAARDLEKAMVAAGKLILKAQVEALNNDETKKPRPLRKLPDWFDEKAGKQPTENSIGITSYVRFADKLVQHDDKKKSHYFDCSLHMQVDKRHLRNTLIIFVNDVESYESGAETVFAIKEKL